MTINDIKTFRNTTITLIRSGRLRDAFSAMRSFSEGNMTWEITSAIDNLEGNYAAMLRYMAAGANDPNRNEILADINAEAESITDILSRRALMVSGSTLYYTTARSLSGADSSLNKLIDRYRDEFIRLDKDYDSLTDARRTVHLEAITRDIFYRIWTMHPLSTADAQTITNLLNETWIPISARQLFASAVALGDLELYDRRKSEILIDLYLNENTPAELALRGLISFIIVLYRYRKKPLNKSLKDRIRLAAEKQTWTEDIKSISLEFLRTRNTKSISDRLNKEIFPTLQEIAPKMTDILGDKNFSPEALMNEANPDWENLFQGNGVGDMLREISEIQADGGDIYMSSFSNLKQFPFFRELSNWFLPFDVTHSEVASGDSFDGSIGRTLASMPMLCDNDKYSVSFSIAMAANHNQRNAIESMKMQSDEMMKAFSELEKARGNGQRTGIISNYIRNLYRFYNLFRRKGEFFNPFDHGSINPLDIDLIANEFDDLDTLTAIAEFDIKNGFWNEALALLKRLDRDLQPDPARSQKIGYCHEKLDQLPQAISYYQEASMLGGQSAWLLNRMGLSLHRHNRPREAAKCFEDLLKLQPDKTDAVIMMGKIYLDARESDKAEQAFHKAIYMEQYNLEAMRGLAWAQFLNRKLDAAKESSAKILDMPDSVPADFIRAGHIARALNDLKSAIRLYRQALIKTGNDIESIRNIIENESMPLADYGFTQQDTILILEAMQYGSDD